MISYFYHEPIDYIKLYIEKKEKKYNTLNINSVFDKNEVRSYFYTQTKI